MRAKPCPAEVIEALQQEFREAVLSQVEVNGQTRITVAREKIRDILAFLKHLDVCPFEMLSDITAHDQIQLKPDEPRFVVMYTLTSLTHNRRLVLRALVPEEDCRIDSSWGIYKTGKWTEREVYEMFGIRFEGHPNLKRLITPDYFDEEEQYPLRKEYPLRGIGDRYAFPVYDPEKELDLSKFGFDPAVEPRPRGALGRG